MINGQFNDYAIQMMGQNGFLSNYANNTPPEWLLKFMFVLPIVIVVFLVWSLFWKGWALWESARRGEKVWFALLLVVNTLGLLEILYLFWFSKKSDSKPVADGK